MGHRTSGGWRGTVVYSGGEVRLPHSWEGHIRIATLSTQAACSGNCLWPLPLWVALG